ncbi:MAG: carboxypeptidase-like regulatory domain-containing protein [Planctomycetota bacterium]
MGLVLAVLVAALGVFGLVLLSARRAGGRGALGEGSGEVSGAPREAALTPARSPQLEPATTLAQPGELEPFASGRTDPHDPRGHGSLRGHVEVSGEEPFPRVWQLELRPSATLPGRESAEVRTLEFTRGEQDFEVSELALGGYDVRAAASGFNGLLLAVPLEAGNEHPFVNLRLVPAGMLTGRVLEADGAPAEGIPVTLFGVANGDVREAASDALGVYRFEGLPDGAYELLFGRATAPLIPERRPVRFSAPGLTFPDTELPALGAIAVRVVDSLARPLEGILVRGSGTNGGLIEGTTDFDGRLLARHLPAGHFRLRLSFPGQPESRDRRRAVDVIAGQVAEAPIRMDP